MKIRNLLHAFILLVTLVLGKWALVIWFYVAILYFLSQTFKKEGFSYNIAALLLYLIPLELFARILQASPFIPYEAGKYVTFVILIYGLARVHIRKAGWIILTLVLILPGLVMVSLRDPIKEIVFNLLGLINMLLGALLFLNVYVTISEVKKLIVQAIYPLMVLLFYLIIVSPDVSSVNYELGALDDLTADFGSNQVSTVLGYGIMLFGFLFLAKWKFSKIYFLDQALLLTITLWSLLSFSRGGVLGALLALGAIVVMNFISKTKHKQRKIKLSSILGVFMVLAVSFYVGNTITGGSLLLRYQGESRGTLLGSKERDLNQLTTGRFEILLRDIDIWSNNPVLGVGVGNARVVGAEEYDNGKIPHVEPSRLLAEHGVPGLMIIFMIYCYPFILLMRQKSQLKRNWMIALLLLSLFSTLHAATRTMISPILFSLAFININEE
ncbi:MAG: O-antigen ligase family protein [Roseivirga sp.]|nr:O-antigen ligase family protein [Roseivirga sp.]